MHWLLMIYQGNSKRNEFSEKIVNQLNQYLWKRLDIVKKRIIEYYHFF